MPTATATTPKTHIPPSAELPHSPAFRVIADELFAASITLSAITGLLDMLARRVVIIHSPGTVEYLLEAMGTLTGHVAQAIVHYAEISSLSPVEMLSLRTALDLNTE